MARSPRPFTQTDLVSIFKAAKAAGYDQACVEIELKDGRKIIARAGKDAAESDVPSGEGSEWDNL